MSNQYVLRTFNDEGLTEFERIIDQIRIGGLTEIPEDLYNNEDVSETHEPIINIEKVEC